MEAILASTVMTTLLIVSLFWSLRRIVSATERSAAALERLAQPPKTEQPKAETKPPATPAPAKPTHDSKGRKIPDIDIDDLRRT